MTSLIDRQIELEHESLFLGQKRYAEEVATNGLTSSSPGKEQLKRALPALAQAIADFLLSEPASATADVGSLHGTRSLHEWNHSTDLGTRKLS